MSRRLLVAESSSFEGFDLFANVAQQVIANNHRRRQQQQQHQQVIGTGSRSERNDNDNDNDDDDNDDDDDDDVPYSPQPARRVNHQEDDEDSDSNDDHDDDNEDNDDNDNNNDDINNAPIERKKGYVPKDTKHYYAQRQIGKISNRDKKVASLPPLKSCKKSNKQCECQQLVDDVDAQKMLRMNYVNTIKNATSFDAGNLLLLNYMHIKQPRRKSKSLVKKSRYWYEVPNYDKQGKIHGRIPVCVETFASLFGFRPHSNKMKALHKRKKDPNQCIQFKTWSKPFRAGGLGDDARANLKKVLETEPRQMVTCGDNNSKRYYYSSHLNYFEFWKKYLRLYGTEEDKLFLQQAQAKNFYPTYHYPTKIKRPIVYSQEDPQRKPSVSYTSACNYWREFDIRFYDDRKKSAVGSKNNSNSTPKKLGDSPPSSSLLSPAERMNQLAQAIGLKLEKLEELRPTEKVALLEEEILGQEQPAGKLLDRIQVLEEELQNYH